MKLLKFSFLFAVLFSTKIYASSDIVNEVEDISSIEMVEVVEDALGKETELKIQKHNKSNVIGEFLFVSRDLIAFGKEVYKIIEAGKPVINIQEVEPISILPKNEKGKYIDAFDLENWRMPKSKKLRVIARNVYGKIKVSFDIMIIFTYGGTYRGKGAFITGAEVVTTDVNVGWLYSLDADFKVNSIVNQGSSDNPIAAAVLKINYRVATPRKESRSSKQFMINGLGQVRAY
jgi:hypothetical protein